MINVIAQFKTILATGISKTATSGVLDSNSSSDNDGATIPNGDYGIVIDERNSSREYAIITVDGFNFTFVKRGLSVIDGITEKDANKFDHRKGAEVKIVSHPILPLIVSVFNGKEAFGGVPLLPTDRELNLARQVVDKEYVDAISSAGILAMLVTKGTGLTININAGTYLLNGVVKEFSAASDVAITDDATNYIQVKDSAVEITTDAFDDDVIPLAVVVAASGAITSVVDKRPFYTGVDVLENGGIGRSSSGIFIKLGTDSALEVDTEDSELKVVVKEAGGILRGTDGLYLAGKKPTLLTTAMEDLTAGENVFVAPAGFKQTFLTGENTDSAGGSYAITTAGPKVGQSFTATKSSLAFVVLKVNITGSGSFNTMSLYAADIDGLPTGAALATSTRISSMSSNGDSANQVLFYFGEALTIGNKYVLTADVTSGYASNYVSFPYSSTSQIANGNALYYSGSWANNVNADLVIKIYEQETYETGAFLTSSADIGRCYFVGKAAETKTAGNEVLLNLETAQDAGYSLWEQYFAGSDGADSATAGLYAMKIGTVVEAETLYIDGPKGIASLAMAESRKETLISFVSSTDYGDDYAGFYECQFDGTFYFKLGSNEYNGGSSSQDTTVKLYKNGSLVLTHSTTSGGTAITYSATTSLTVAKGDILHVTTSSTYGYSYTCVLENWTEITF